MKKNLFRTVVLAASLLVGGLNANAQKGYNVPTLSPEFTAMAQSVVDNQLADPDEANKSFGKLLKKISKSKEDLLAAGQFFLDNNNFPAAKQCADKLYNLDPTYTDGLMFRGEVFMFAKKWGEAGQMFDQVLAIEPTHIAAMKRNAFVYKNVNPYVAVETLLKIKELQPDYYAADKELGDIRYNMNEYAEAVKHYDLYYPNTPKEELDIRSCENYLMSLYSVKQFEKITQLVAELEPLAPNDMMIKRMKFFASVENARASINYEADMAKAGEAMNYIVNKEFADSAYLYLDYAYAADYKKEMSDFPAAIEYYNLAISKDSTKLNAYTELAKLYRRNKQYDEAIATYKNFMTLAGDKAKLTDILGFGQMYMYASQQEGISPEQKAAYVEAGDAVFQQVLEKEPTAYQAMLFRARINIVDGTQPEEKPKALYEEALKMMEGKEDTDRARIEACRYLAFYNVQKDQLDEARKYTDMILSVDPENSMAKQIDAYLKSQNK